MIASMGEGVAWSSWDFTFEDVKWHGVLTVLAIPWSNGDYRVDLHVEVEGSGQNKSVFMRHN